MEELKVVFDQSWPFDIRIVNSQGVTIHKEERAWYSTAQRSIDEVMKGRGFAPEERSTAIAANKEQVEKVYLRAGAPALLNAASKVLDCYLNHDMTVHPPLMMDLQTAILSCKPPLVP